MLKELPIEMVPVEELENLMTRRGECDLFSYLGVISLSSRSRWGFAKGISIPLLGINESNSHGRKIYLVHAKPSDYFVRIDGGKYDREHYYQSPQSYTSLFCDKVKRFSSKYAPLLIIFKKKKKKKRWRRT